VQRRVPGPPRLELGRQIPLCDPGDSGSDLQPPAPREALLACRAPSALQRRAAALCSGPALLGVRLAGGGTRQVGAPMWKESGASEQRWAHGARGQPQGQTTERKPGRRDSSKGTRFPA
jgi:hypothetical protein